MASKVTLPVDSDGHVIRAELKANGNVVHGHSTAAGEIRVVNVETPRQTPKVSMSLKLRCSIPKVLELFWQKQKIVVTLPCSQTPGPQIKSR